MAPADIEYARELGYRIKHLGIAKRENDALQLRVHPTLIPEAKAIAQVDGVLNAVMINASGVGELLLVGRRRITPNRKRCHGRCCLSCARDRQR